ncbi:MAG TPA: copper homeostasis periplasmic binding protein CopC [Telluria sp.]|nr:copper homeostasis periplasmic binding protein CopC [Telluria sp.]
MTRIVSYIVAAALVIAAPAVLAHAALKQSTPAAGSQLEHAPQHVVLTFNEKVEPAFSSIDVLDAAGKPVGGKAVAGEGNPAQLTFALPALASGTYQVNWVAVGPDGHRRKGSFQFTVK